MKLETERINSIIDAWINGNREQARTDFLKLSKAQICEFMRYCNYVLGLKEALEICESISEQAGLF